MKTKLKLAKLKTCLPDSVIEALDSQGFFSGEPIDVKRRTVIDEKAELAEGERSVIRYVSTRDVDRDREVLDPHGAILDQFLLAPQVLWAHDYSMPPTGKADWIKADKNGLKSKTTYAETERAEEVWQLIKGGYLKTASVGFIPVQRVWKGDREWDALVAKYNAKWDTDLDKAGAEIITTKWILLEYSDVPVPANPHALITAVAKGLNLSPAMMEQLGLEEDDEDEQENTEQVNIKQKLPIEPRLVVALSQKTHPRFVRVVKSAPDNDRRVIAVTNEVLAQMRGRV